MPTATECHGYLRKGSENNTFWTVQNLEQGKPDFEWDLYGLSFSYISN